MRSNEWYTPKRYIEAARKAMGSIDLDPASCEVANQIVEAKQYYTKQENGLAQQWYGNVYLNPPFVGTARRHLWTKRLITEYRLGHVEQAILLMPSSPDTKWFQPLWDFPVCFPKHRIVFLKEGMLHDSPNFGSCFVYLGHNEETFIEAFRQFGPIVKRVSA